MVETNYTGTGVVAASDYKYVKWVGRTKSGQAVTIEMPKAICKSNIDWTFAEKDHFKGFKEHLIAPSAKFIISQIMSIVTFPAVFFNRHTKPLDYDDNFILGVKLVLVPHINFLSALLALAVRSQPFILFWLRSYLFQPCDYIIPNLRS